MKIDKEVFDLWKEISPSSAFSQGLKECVATVWVPNHSNTKAALSKISRLRKRTKDERILRLLKSLERGIVFEEPQNPPGSVLSVFYTHLVVEGIKEKHVIEIAEQCIALLGCKQYLCEVPWPVELQIHTAQSCDGAVSILQSIKRKCKRQEVKESITALQKRIKVWREGIVKTDIKAYDFKSVFPIIKKRSKGLGRVSVYPKILKDLYGYTESPAKIEKLALKWIDEEIGVFNGIVKRLSKRFGCKASISDIESELNRRQKVPVKDLVKITKSFRKVLRPLAEQDWVRITPKYDTRVVSTPSYLVPMLPTAAMQPFNAMTDPFCLFFQTDAKKASPCKSLSAVAQVIIHEEYGHSVNFMNSFVHFQKKLRVIDLLETSLEIPITEGISFFRELESVRSFERIRAKANTKQEKALVRYVEKFVPFDEFVDTVSFIVYQWRIVRFLRALMDSRVNTDKQPYSKFLDWAHKKTGLSKELIFYQTFLFQRFPGYAPCYSVIGQRLRALQKKAVRKGFSAIEFNTFVASIGFPARSVFENEIKKKFRL